MSYTTAIEKSIRRAAARLILFEGINKPTAGEVAKEVLKIKEAKR